MNKLPIHLLLLIGFLFCQSTLKLSASTLTDEEQIGRWVNFGIKGGQPQGGVLCLPKMNDLNEDIIFTTGDITGLRKSVTGGGDWFTHSDPTSPEFYAEFGNLAFDLTTFTDSMLGNETIYLARVSTRFNQVGGHATGIYDNLLRSSDGGKSFQRIGDINVKYKKVRYSSLSIAPQGTGNGLFAALSNDGQVYLYSLSRSLPTASQIDLSATPISMIYDVEALDDNSAVITTDAGVYALSDYTLDTITMTLIQDESLYPLDGPTTSELAMNRYMYLDPEKPHVIWLAQAENNRVLKSIDAGASWSITSDLSFSPGLLAASGGDDSGTNAHVVVSEASKDDPYQRGAFKSLLHYSSDGGVTFSASKIAVNDGTDSGYPIRGGAKALNQLCARDGGEFHVARFGGYMRSVDGGETFAWHNRGIHGLNTNSVDLRDGIMTVTHNDHGIFRTSINTGMDDPWQEFLYDNWKQLDHKTKTHPTNEQLATGVDAIVDPVDSNVIYYIKTKANNPEVWLIRKTTNGAINNIDALPSDDLDADWKNIFDSTAWSSEFTIKMVLDYQAKWLGQETLLIATSCLDKNCASGKGVVKIGYKETAPGVFEWVDEELNGSGDGALSETAKRGIKNIHTDLYGNVYIRTYDNNYRYNRATDAWKVISEVGHEGKTNFNAVAFDPNDASKVYYADQGELLISNNFGETFSEDSKKQFPIVPEYEYSTAIGSAVGTKYFPKTLAVGDDALYAGMAIQYPFVAGDGSVPKGGVMKSVDDGDTWFWLNQSGMQTAEVDRSLIFGDDGYLYAAESGSGLSRYEIIVDNKDLDATKPYYFLTRGEGWKDTTAIDPEKQFGPEVKQPRSSVYFTNQGSRGAAIWRFQVPETGYYKVFTRWNAVTEESMREDPRYVVKHAEVNGVSYTRITEMNQTENSGTWQWLKEATQEGVYKFNQGEKYEVKLISNGNNASVGKVVDADAIRLEPFKPEVIIDNSDTVAGEDVFFSQSGGDIVSHYQGIWRYPYGPQKGYAPDSVCPKVDAQGDSQWAKWKFKVPVSGYYEVYAWWAGGPQYQSSKAFYRVNHDEDNGIAQKTKPQYQKDNHGRWMLLTTDSHQSFHFTAGETYDVSIYAKDQEYATADHYNADAIRVVFSGR